jgi:hypothetical protein
MLDSSGSFGAGRSARPPSGEPDIGALARAHGVACIEVLVAALDGSDVGAAVEAAKTLLNLGYGAPERCSE